MKTNARLTLLYITNDVARATYALECGVDRIFIDMEVLGKEERQGHLNTHRAAHTISDVQKLRDALPTATLLVRINPIHEGTKQEINNVIKAGADYIMLPMYRTESEVRQFLKLVNRRAKTTLLLETPQALVRLNRILLQFHSEINEVHIGLNDLHLGLGLDFMFETLESGLIEMAANLLKKNNIRFGIGGISRIGGTDAVPAKLLLGEHVRLNSEMVILSRSFSRNNQNNKAVDLAAEIKKLRDSEKVFRQMSDKQLLKNQEQLNASIRNFVQENHD